jgi:hypothetical protein
MRPCQITARDIVAALNRLPNQPLPIFQMLTDFLLTEGNPDWLEAHTPQVEVITTRTAEAIRLTQQAKKLCLDLKPVYTPQIPLGF